ncbi:hypothetical protein NTHI1209_02241 [Haemophilus influenzae]|uniref:Uncharacterized protein n=1 Tax=Haemophilus influenzae TaxID=727 RepID=A0A158T0D7_HAEIF|nr:hypothetical protein NTHI1209_02241 [Haemophilus influenzae]
MSHCASEIALSLKFHCLFPLKWLNNGSVALIIDHIVWYGSLFF